MTLSILWVALAGTVTIVASMRRSGASVRARQSGKALTVVAVVYSLALLAGFLYIGWQHSLALLK